MKKIEKSYIHFLIALIITFAFRWIPAGVLPYVTPIGLQVLGIFVATVYLWTTIDPMVSSLYAIIMVALSDYAAAGAVLQTTFGNPVVIQMFFLMIFMAGLTERKVTVYIARWIMTRKVIEGRPWIFTLTILTGVYLMSAFIGAFAPIFLFWPILYSVFQEIGYKPGDKYPTVMLISIVICALLGFPVPPYMSNGLALLGNYRGLLERSFVALQDMKNVMINDGTYFVFTLLLGYAMVIVTVLIMRFVFRPDVKPLKTVTIEMLEKRPLPPMDKAQKIYGIVLVLFVFLMLIPSILPNLPVLSFLNKNSFVLATLVVGVLLFIQVEDGPVMRFASTMGRQFSWPTFFLCTAAIMLGSVLTDASTGVTLFLNTILSPIFSRMSGTVFTIVLLVVAVVITNLANSLVMGMILQPVVLTYCMTSGVNPAPIIGLLIFTVLSSAACTPAASPFAAMLFGNKQWLDSKDVYKITIPIVAIEVGLILLLGVPLASFIYLM